MTGEWRGLTSPEEYSECIGAIYDCSVDPDLWPVALERIAGLMNGVNGVILLLDTASSANPLQASLRLHRTWNVDPTTVAEFERDFAADNPLPGFFQDFDVDQPYNVPMVIDVAKWEETRLFREFAQPRGYRDSIGVYLMKSSRRAASLSIVTSADAGYCGPRELRLMQLIAPHARRALAIGDLFDMQSLMAEAARSALDTLAPGVILLDAAGRVILANRSIREREDADMIAVLSGDRVEFVDRRVEASIRRMVLRDADAPAAMTCATAGGSGVPVFIHAVTIEEQNQRSHMAPEARLAIFVSPPGGAADIPARAWSDGFGLTPTEVAVLGQLVDGLSPEAIASAMGIRLATVRTHLSRLYSKTGTERQVDLVRLAHLLHLPVRSRDRDGG